MERLERARRGARIERVARPARRGPLQRRRRHRAPPAGHAVGGRDRTLGHRLGPAVVVTFHALDGVTTYPDIAFRKASLNELSAATGLKFNILNRLLVNANLLFRLNSEGLVDKVSPLLGLEYAF